MNPTQKTAFVATEAAVVLLGTIAIYHIVQNDKLKKANRKLSRIASKSIVHFGRTVKMLPEDTARLAAFDFAIDLGTDPVIISK